MRRDRIHFSARVVVGLLMVSALLVASRTALAQTAAGSFQSVSGQVQIQRAGGATIGAATGVGVNVGNLGPTPAVHQTTAARLEKPRFALGSVVTFAPSQSGLYNLGSSVSRSRPPKDKEVAAAERAPKRQKKPVKSCFKGIPVSDTSEIDRSAMWAPCEEHTLQYRDSPGSTGYFS